MDHEQKYNDILIAVKKLQEANPNDEGIQNWIDDNFPELKESENELTWLTKYIEEEVYSLSIDIRDDEDRIKLKKLQKALAWLEKQWSEEDEKAIDDAIYFLDMARPHMMRVKEVDKCIKWLKSLKERMT